MRKVTMIENVNTSAVKSLVKGLPREKGFLVYGGVKTHAVMAVAVNGDSNALAVCPITEPGKPLVVYDVNGVPIPDMKTDVALDALDDQSIEKSVAELINVKDSAFKVPAIFYA